MISWDRNSERAARVRQRTGRALPWILIAATVVNLGMMERYLTPSRLPILTNASPALSALVQASQPHTRAHYQLYVDLADVAEGATLVVPAAALLDHRLARGLGRVRVEVRDYEPAVTDAPVDLPARPMGLVATPIGALNYWLIPGLPGDTYWVARLDRSVVVVPSSVLAVPEASS